MNDKIQKGSRVRFWFATDVFATVTDIDEIREAGRLVGRRFKLQYDSKFYGIEGWIPETDLRLVEKNP